MIKTGFSGKFRLEVRNVHTHQITKVREFNNTITDAGLNGYGKGTANLLGRCMVGAGTSIASTTATGMGSVIASVNGAGSGQVQLLAPVEPEWSAGVKLKYRFEAGSITTPISEIGICNRKDHGATDFVLWSRTLITDANGTPTSLTILADEYLDVYYILNLHLDLTDKASSFDLNGVNYNYTARAAMVQSSLVNVADGNLHFANGITIKNVFNGNTLGQITESIREYTKSANPSCSVSLSPYIDGTFQRDCIAEIATGNGNIDGGILGLEIGPNGNGNQLHVYSQIALDKAIPKDSSKSIKFTLRSSWGRYTA